MKTVTILQTVEIPNMPAFKRGAEVRVSDKVADVLIERKHAKLVKGKTRAEVAKKKKKDRARVKVTKK